MELYRDILCEILESEEFEIMLPKWKMKVDEMIEMKCYHAIEEIKKILEEDTLNDAECLGVDFVDTLKAVSVRKPLFYKV